MRAFGDMRKPVAEETSMARCEICGKRAGFMVDVCSACVEAKKSGKPLPENKAWIAAQSSRRKGLWFGGITGAVVGITAILLQGGDPFGAEGSMELGKTAGVGALLGALVGRTLGWWQTRKRAGL